MCHNVLVLGLIPIKVDVPMYRLPWANAALIGVIMVISLWGGTTSSPIVADMVLRDWSLTGLLGHMTLHAGGIHLVGNMLFLWVFGNAVCAKTGNLAFIGLFLLLGILAAAIHLGLDGRPMIGASGAINGIVGMFLVLYPRNDITCFWFFFIKFGTFCLSSVWMILFWLAFDLWGVFSEGGNVAYWAHLGGIAAGATMAVVGLRSGWIEMERSEESLLDLLAVRG